LKKIQDFSSSKEFRIVWVYNEEPKIVEKSWARCRGYAMEDIIRSFVEETLFRRKCEDMLNLPSNRYELYEYFYDGTDTDILLRENDPSMDDVEKTWKRHWVVFNIKTSSENLLDTNSVKRFSRLCEDMCRKENELLGKCSLILVAGKMDKVAKLNLMTTWKDFEVLGVWDLDYFFSMLLSKRSMIYL
jgi:hypothetical protein